MTQLERKGMAWTLFVVYESQTINLPSFNENKIMLLKFDWGEKKMKGVRTVPEMQKLNF